MPMLPSSYRRLDLRDLTIGIELEFMVVYNEEDFRQGPFAVQDTLRRYLVGLGVEPTPAFPNTPPGRSGSQWRVVTDCHDLLPDEAEKLQGGLKRCPIELISPAYWYRTGLWRAQVSLLFDLLAVFQRDNDCRIITNTDTGFHVHVGASNGDGIPLEPCKNLLHLVTAFERHIDRLHSASRVSITGNTNWFCKAPSYFFRNGLTTKGLSSYFFRHLAIEAAVRHSGLGMLFIVPRGGDTYARGKESAYNFENLYEDRERGRSEEFLIHTIEFRQHVGTMDRVEIFAWIRTVAQMVRWASTVSHSEVEHMLFTVMPRTSRNEDGTLDFLRYIEIDDVTLRFYERFLSRTVDYAESYRDQRIKEETDDTFRALVERVENNRYAARNSSSICYAIAQKQLCNCYGRDEDLLGTDTAAQHFRATFRVMWSLFAFAGQTTDLAAMQNLRRQFGLADVVVTDQVHLKIPQFDQKMWFY